MNWFRIRKEDTTPPEGGNYKSWKELLAKEGCHQCVYCAISEAAFGGTRNFHVEHFRPRRLFDHLENDFQNLFYACAICNGFKSSDWPGEVTEKLSAIGYCDPSRCDLAKVFDVDRETKVVGAESVTGRYMVERLFLNRPQLILERRWDASRTRSRELCVWAFAYLEQQGLDRSSAQRLLDLLRRIVGQLHTVHDTRPYMESDVRRR